MSIQRIEIENTLSGQLPRELVCLLLDEYVDIKKQFFSGHFRPTELNAARFSEYTLRLLQFIWQGKFTPVGEPLKTETIINEVCKQTGLTDSIRFHIPRLVRVLLDIRNKRNVAHTGGEVDPNYSDSLFVSHAVDWILIELIRNYHTNSIDEARKIVESINEKKVPIATKVDDRFRVLNPELNINETILVILYSEHPSKVAIADLISSMKHLTNGINSLVISSLRKLNRNALIYCPNDPREYLAESDSVSILPTGILYVEKNIDLEISIDNIRL